MATIGPATKDKNIVRELIKSQMDVARLNFSWGTYEEHASYINTIREIAKESDKRIPIIQDLPGPRVQETGGHEFDVNAQEILTEKDLADLDFGAKHDLDYVAMSFVGSGRDIERLRQEMAKRNFKKPIIAKIERKKALENIDEIINAADAVMVARGDLGNEIPLEQIPYAQHEIIQKAKAAKKPVITATQMMLSMMDSPAPTRAEVSDIAYAVLDGSDAVMLSEETARGKYPVEAVKMMEKIVLEAEKHELKIIIHPL